MGSLLAADGPESIEVLFRVVEGSPVDIILEVETVALGEGIVDESACAELPPPPPLAPAAVRDVPIASVGRPIVTLPLADA